MLPSSKKVSNSLFKTLISKGRSFNEDLISVRVYVSNSTESAKFSVVVPKKIEKNAVGRNLMKRRLYSRLRIVARESKPGSLVAIFVRKKILASDLDAVSQKIRQILTKISVLKN